MVFDIISTPRGRFRLLSLVICLLFFSLAFRMADFTNMLNITELRELSYPGVSSDSNVGVATKKHGKLRRLNSTLGFEKVMYINLPWRHDKDDAMVLQAAVSEVDLTKFPGVLADEMLAKGLGPSTNKGLRDTERACFRSHMNAWQTIIQNNWQSALILESDAGWDTDIRAIMAYFAVGLEELIHRQGLASKKAKATTSDPYLSKYWDVLQFSACADRDPKENTTLIYYDPYVVPGTDYHGLKLGENERVLRYGSFGACTTAYAVSKRGAMKLLQKATVDMYTQVDLFMWDMADALEVHSFITTPDLFAQTGYHPGIGMGDRISDNKPDGERQPGEQEQAAWDFVHEKISPWIVQDFYDWVKFKRFALWDLKDYLYKSEP